MNCLEAQQLLQDYLDGRGDGDRAGLKPHLSSCPSCRELFTAARWLEQGIHTLATPLPSPGLAERIVSQVLAEHRSRQRRRWTGVAVAASLLLACLAGYSWWQSGKAPAPTPAPVVRQEEKAVPQPPAPPLVRNPQKANPTPKTPSLTETVQDAQSALVQLGQRTAEETVEGGRHLMPREVPTPPEANTGLLTETLDPPARSLAEAGQDVSVGLEPVTNSAKRAVNLFLEEIPPVQSGKKTGW